MFVYELDRDGVVRRWSPSAERALGWTADEMVGVDAATIQPEADGELADALERAAREPLTSFATAWRCKPGTVRNASVTAMPLSDRAGEITGFAMIAGDHSQESLDQAQMQAFARDVRESYTRELKGVQELEESYVATVTALAAAVEAKDGYTGGHIRRVHDLGLRLAGVVAPDDAGDPQMSFGFLLHDIGKLAVPDAVLQKPGKLEEEEWDLMRRHPQEGVRVLRPVGFLDRALDVVLHHHERWDGTGYPAKLRGEGIPLWARIFAIADTVDAMTSDRPYRAALPLEAALEEVDESCGSQFDPACGAALAEVERNELAELLSPRKWTG